MSPQTEFNLTHPVSHSRDPDTSKAAERSITDSGKRKSNNQRIHWVVCRWPGMTASELTDSAMGYYQDFKEMGFDKALIEVRRRLSDMHHKHTRQGDKRMGKLNNLEVTWYPK